MSLQYSQIRHLSWPKGRARSLFNFPASRNYTRYHSLQRPKPSDKTVEAQKYLPIGRLGGRPSARGSKQVERSTLEPQNHAGSAVRSTYRNDLQATKKRPRVVTKYRLLYALVTSGILVSILLSPRKRKDIMDSLNNPVHDGTLDHQVARLRTAWTCTRLSRFAMAV
jgi:hypothetical protein